MEEIDTISKTVDEGTKKKKKKKKVKKEGEVERQDEDKKSREDVLEPIQLPPIKVSSSRPPNEKEETVAEDDDNKNDGKKKKVKKAKKKKKKTGLDEENEMLEQKLTERELKRKSKKTSIVKRRRRNSVVSEDQEEALEDRIRDPALALVLRDLQDDIHIVDGGGALSLTPRVPTPLPPLPVSSTLVNKIFTERPNGGFANTVKRQSGSSKAVRLSSVDPQHELLLLPPPSKQRKTPLELGMDTQKAFRSFGIFCHGFLAGMAFWHLVTVIVLTWGEDDVLDFIALYSPLSQPVQCIFYFLAVTCTISIMDRYDLAMFDWRQLQQLLTFRSGGLALVVYFATLVVNLSTANLDDKISLYQSNATIFERMEDEDLVYEFQTWKSLNCCRSVGFILGWFLVSLRPNTDLLHKHLRRLGGNSGKLVKSTPMKLLGMDNGASKIKY